MAASHTLTVAIDAQVTPEKNGGVALALLALIRALGQLDDGQEAYRLVVASDDQKRFWEGQCQARQTVIDRRGTTGHARQPSASARLVKRLKRALARQLAGLSVEIPRWPQVPVSTGFYESIGCDILHFPWQHFELCALPTVFQPHDLQHLHYPQFFSIDEILHRETIYPAGCRWSQAVIVGSQWTKSDVVRQYGIDPSKIQVIPEGSPTQLAKAPEDSEKQQLFEERNLREPFILYPAISWPHKNHLTLIEALARLRDVSNLKVQLVCTGSVHEPSWPALEARIRNLGLEDQVRFLGFLSETHLRILQRSAHAVVVPSLFEASSLPIYEAWMDGVPVASSNAAALPDQVQDAGLLFDPASVPEIAQAIETLMTDTTVRDRLQARGRQRLMDFDWVRTAKCYRAVYRRVAHRPLSDEDRSLLSVDWSLSRPNPDQAEA